MFDESTGQVFQEWTLSRRDVNIRTRDHDWPFRLQPPVLTAEPTEGPRSLMDMVARVVAENIASVTDEHMDAMPWTVRSRVWRLLKEGGLCLHAWKLFNRKTPDGEGVKACGYTHHICKTYDNALQVYTRPLDAPATQFISHLFLSRGCEFSTSELLCLADMRNLGILEIVQAEGTMDGLSGRPHVTDRLVRGWSEKEDPFPALRLLRVWCVESTTEASFQWVSKFPGLAVYDVVGRREDWRKGKERALEKGWRRDSSTLIGDFKKTYLMLFDSGKAGELVQDSPCTSLKTLEDVFAQGPPVVLMKPVVPSKPIASLTLGHTGWPEVASSYRGYKVGRTIQNTFTRFSAILGSTGSSQPVPDEKEKDIKAAPGSTRAEAGHQKGVVRSRKRKRLDDVLRSMAG
ncbi:hypothetical protein ACRE_054780 [Hapsidospora chrysogenum ATCC 11550]|uniref:Uncharacterized protein n=1 Tax=Hapsidospora chrysogenum (strain ATCC 11550 / CBS 779.69 / DSM 880 / IAM 14645 / JCM 23072 / IMI 49137) TaxID=857340 RepID=A0A086T351_HAPC1|nr:hypothetical protein ACRE_054780 [Hapsidospora chrysogenum ATCC 11550]